MYILFHAMAASELQVIAQAWSSLDVDLASEIFVGKFAIPLILSYLNENQLGESTFFVACLPAGQEHTLECEGMKATLFAQDEFQEVDAHSEFSLYLFICQTFKMTKDFVARHF